MIDIAKKPKFSFIIADPATSHATLCLASLSRDLTRSNTPSPTTLYHRFSAIKLIRERLKRESIVSQEQVLAGAIALLISADVSKNNVADIPHLCLMRTQSLEGNWNSSSAHLNGLMTIVDQAGGVKSLCSENDVLSSILAWYVS